MVVKRGTTLDLGSIHAWVFGQENIEGVSLGSLDGMYCSGVL